MTAPHPETDDELARALEQGDPSANILLGHRFGRGLYDFALRVTLDEDAADSVTRVALARAAEAGDRIPADLPLRLRLLWLARDEALEGVRQRKPEAGIEETRLLLPPADDRFFRSRLPWPDADYPGIAWQAARLQRPRDYSLLDLTLRKGVAAEEAADIASLSRPGVYAVLGRLRAALEETFSSSVLFYRGPPACPEIAAIVTESGSTLTPSLRREIRHHADQCPTCQRLRDGLPLAADVLASLRDVELPPALSSLFGADEPAAGPKQNGASLTPLALAVNVAEPEPALPVEAAANAVASGNVSDAAPAAATTPVPDSEDAVSAAAPIEESIHANGAHSLPQVPAIRDQAAVPLDEAEITVLRPLRLPRPGDVAVLEDEEGPILLSAELLDGAVPPRRPWQWLSDFFAGNFRWAVFFGGVAIALYVGVALGDSIDSGGRGDSNQAIAPALLPSPPPGLRQAACGARPVNTVQGERLNLVFDPPPPQGFEISTIGIKAISPNASPQGIDAVGQQGPGILLDARPVPGPAGRTDEYELMVNFQRGADRAAARCTVLVASSNSGPGTAASPTSTPTATPPPSPTSPPPTAIPPTATRAPIVVVPTQPPPSPTEPPPPPPTATEPPPPPTATTIPPTATDAPPRTATPIPSTPSATPFPTATKEPPTATLVPH
jgi:hypothetical protein